MKATILDPQVKVYSSMDENSLSIATLQTGTEIEYGGMKRKAGKFWKYIILSTGQQAYIPGVANLYLIREGTLMQDHVEVHSEPSAGSLIKQQLKRKDKVSILQVTKEKDWVRIRDTTGNEGFISGDTRLRLAPIRTKDMGRKNMLSGGMWLAAGLIMIISENSSPSGSGLSMLGYFALLFGIAMFISGLLQFIKAPA